MWCYMQSSYYLPEADGRGWLVCLPCERSVQWDSPPIFSFSYILFILVQIWDLDQVMVVGAWKFRLLKFEDGL